jgi:hypothetical protein
MRARLLWYGFSQRLFFSLERPDLGESRLCPTAPPAASLMRMLLLLRSWKVCLKGRALVLLQQLPLQLLLQLRPANQWYFVNSSSSHLGLTSRAARCYQEEAA